MTAEDTISPRRHAVDVAANIVGWGAVVMVTIFTTFWAFWGTIEAFHEGWCRPYLWMRLIQLMVYLSLAATLGGLCVVGIRWPRIGAALFVLLGAVIATLIVVTQARFSGFLLFALTSLPITVGVLFWFGRPRPRSAAYAVAVIPPLLTILACGVEPVVRVSSRFDDGNRAARVIDGNGVKLLWAPAGPGWARDGNVTWKDAAARAARLSENGMSLANEPQHIWRLPTRDEIVRSLTRSNQNAGGTWDAAKSQAAYRRKPDKESPIWDRYAPLIYLWTSEEADSQRAWIIVYHGGVFSKPKTTGSPSLGFRAVREPP